jgi:hypothetical protein
MMIYGMTIHKKIDEVKLRRGLNNSYVNGSDACRDVLKGRM